MDILAVEVEFRMPLVNPQTRTASRSFDLAGKLDLLARWENLRSFIKWRL